MLLSAAAECIELLFVTQRDTQNRTVGVKVHNLTVSTVCII